MSITKLSNNLWKVDGKTDTYTVWIDVNGVFVCTCPFSSRKYKRVCKHIRIVMETLKNEEY